MDREPLLVALAVVVVIFIYSQQSPRKRKCSHRAPFNRHYKRRFIAACPGESGPRVILPHDFDFLNDVEFKQKYKYQKKTFVKLILLLDAALKPKNKANGLSIPSGVQVAIVIRWFAGGSPSDISSDHGINKKAVVPIAWKVAEAVILNGDNVGKIEFRPEDPSFLLGVAEGFGKSRPRNPLASVCVGCLDGLAVKIIQPSSRECPNVRDYRNRKGFYAVVVEAICDSRRKFLFFACQWPGSTHDSAAFACTSLYQFVCSSLLCGTCFIACDEAYPITGALICPYPGGKSGRLEPFVDSFNFHLSQLRINIEDAFGMFVQRWGILWKKLAIDYRKVPRLLTALAHLHNFAIDEDGLQRDFISWEDIETATRSTLFQNDIETGPPTGLASTLSSTPVTAKARAKKFRDDCVEALRTRGLMRPRRST